MALHWCKGQLNKEAEQQKWTEYLALRSDTLWEVFREVKSISGRRGLEEEERERLKQLEWKGSAGMGMYVVDLERRKARKNRSCEAGGMEEKKMLVTQFTAFPTCYNHTMATHISSAPTFLYSLLQPLEILNVQFLHLRRPIFVSCTCRCLMNLPSTLTPPIPSAKVSNYYVFCNPR